MSHPERERERDTLQTVLAQIEQGAVILKQGADEVVADIQQRLAGLDQPNPPTASD